MTLTHVIHIVRELRNPENYGLSLYAAPVLFTFVAIISFGFFVLIKERRSPVKWSFFLLTVVMGGWLFAFGWMYSATNAATAYRWARMAYLAVPFIPAAGYLFTIKVLRLYDQKKRQILAFFAASAFFSYLLVGTPWMIGGLYHYPWGYYPRYTPYSLTYLAYFIGATALTLRHFFVEYRRVQSPTQRARTLFLLAASGIASLAGLDYLAKFGIPLYPFGYVCILIFIVLTAFVVTQYRLVDVTPSFAVEKIIGTMGDALLVLDAEEIIRVSNDAAAELFGVLKHDLVGSPIASVIPSFPVKNSTEVLHRVGTDHSYEVAYEIPNRARSLFLNISESPMKDEKGCVIATVLIIRDLTQIRMTEAALAETEHRFTALYHEIPEAVIILDEFGRFSSVNPAAEKLLGVTGENLSGKIFVMSRFLPSHCISRVLKVIRNVIQAAPTTPEPSFELELTREDGASVKVQATPSPVKKHGKISEVQILLKPLRREPTPEKDLQKERAEIEKQLRQKLEEMFKDDVYLMKKLEKLKF